MKLANAAANGASIMLIGQWAKFTIQILGTAVLARILSPADFGLVAMVTAVIGIATILSDFGLSLAALRDPNMSQEHRSNLFWVNLLIGALASGIIALAAGPISELYSTPILEPVVVALSVTFFLQAAAGQFRAELSRSLRFSRTMAIEVTAQFVANATAVILALSGINYWALVCQQVILVTLQLAGLACFSGWKPQKPTSLRRTGRHLLFGSKASATQIINYISSNADSVVLGRLWGADTVGIYNQAYQFFKVPVQQLASPLTQVMIPVFSRLTDAQMPRYIIQIQSLLVYCIGGVFLVLASIATPLMSIILGPGWDGVGPILQILAIGGIFQTLGYVYYWIFVVKNLVGSQLVFGGSARVLMVGLIIIFARWGGAGVAWAVTIGLVLNWILLTIFVVPKSGLRRRLFILSSARPLIIIISGFVFSWGAGYLFAEGLNELSLISLQIACWIFYALLLLLLVPVFRSDLISIRNAIQMARKRTT